MKIGIIGSSSFIGNNLYFYLSKYNNFKVIKYSSYKKNNKNWMSLVSQEIKTTKPNIIINCAANQSLKNDKKSIKDLLNSNLYSNINFLEQATQNNTFKGYIYFGTKWEFNQNMKFNPLNFYSATKHANDIFFDYFSQKKNICTVSLKIFDTYGPNDKRSKILNLIIESIKKNKSLKLTPGNQYLDYVHINDLSKLVTKICFDIHKKRLKGFNYFTVSSKKPLSLKKIIYHIRFMLKSKTKIKLGAKKYRKIEAMQKIKKLKNYPGWKPKINFVKELSNILKNL
jgi:CDP-3, 6-dideoxy-D-glycero-L-glycero-4-hexulose-4-reductase